MINDSDPASDNELATYLYTNYGVNCLRDLLKTKPSAILIDALNLTEEQYIAQIEKAIAHILED